MDREAELLQSLETFVKSLEELQEEHQATAIAQATFKSELSTIRTIVLDTNKTLHGEGNEKSVLTRIAVLEDRSLATKESKKGETAITVAVISGCIGMLTSIVHVILKMSK